MESHDELIEKIAHAQSYSEWLNLNKKLDAVENRHSWQADDTSSLYDYTKLHALLKELRLARLQRNIPKLLYLVRTTFNRNVANMGDPRLFSYAHSGTKYLVNEYISECELVLHTLVTSADNTQATDVLNTLVQTRKAFGRTALVFSGGSILGFLHAGVIRELFDNNLLPRIISGSSAGSIFASMLCIHRDEEFDRMWELLSIPMSIFGPAGQDESLVDHLKRFFTVGSWIDSTYLKEMMQGLMGDVTFQEAHNRTGRILNVTVSVAGSHDMPRLLNYLTAPNVVIWSAVVCSCSVPFVFAADSLFAKNPLTKEIYPWSKGAFIDGSVDNDMPLTRLSEMFNVNHFVAVQVNPHIAPLFTSDRRSLDVKDLKDDNYDEGSGWIREKVSRGWEQSRSLFLNEVEHGLTILKAAGITQSAATTLLNVMNQEYWGDITIVPQIHWSDIKSLFKNPTLEKIDELITRGRRATWPKLALIRNHCAVEVALDKAIGDLRSRMIGTVFSPPVLPKMTQNTARKMNGAIPTATTPTNPRPKLTRWDNAHSRRSQSIGNLPSLTRSPSRSLSRRVAQRRASVDVSYTLNNKAQFTTSSPGAYASPDKRQFNGA